MPRLLPALAAAALLALPGGTTALGAAPSSGRAFKSTLTYRETNPGRESGQAILGIVGRGTFSAKLGGRALAAARLLRMLTGAPLDAMAKGGSYVVRFDLDAKGSAHGLVVAKFRAPGVGSLCLAFTNAHGKFVPGKSFIPTTGTVSTMGGTGAGARVSGKGRFVLRNVTGSDVEQFLSDGAVFPVQLAAPKPPNAACKAVAKLL